MDRPTVFLSSTIYDFADLRGAVKDHLEQRGCRVLASEYTDFTRPLDTHSYEACLKTIEQADLFVLFIGRRVGGWHDEPKKISITRAEYRYAYELAKQGRIRLLCLARAEVFEHRQSISEMAKALKSDPELSDAQKERIAKYPTRLMDDAGAIVSFIDEVSRNDETKKATMGKASAPIANWITPFANFTQVRQALDPIIAHGMTVQQAAGRKALEVQLRNMLAGIVPLIADKVLNPVNSVLNLRNDLDIKSDQLTEVIKIYEDNWIRLIRLFTEVSNKRADHEPLMGTLNSELLLTYDPTTGVFEQTKEYDCLARIVDLSRRFARAAASSDMIELFKHGQQASQDGAREIPCGVLLGVMQLLLRWVDLIGTTRALASSLNGLPFEEPRQIPQSSIVGEEQRLAKEKPTSEQVLAFVAKREK